MLVEEVERRHRITTRRGSRSTSTTVEEVERRHRITTTASRRWSHGKVEEVERRHRITTASQNAGTDGGVEEVERRHRITTAGTPPFYQMLVEEVERRHRITPLDSNLESRGVISTIRVPAFKCQRAATRRRLPERRLPVNLSPLRIGERRTDDPSAFGAGIVDVVAASGRQNVEEGEGFPMWRHFVSCHLTPRPLQ